jgi:selenium metabolism protein YedF
MTNNESILLDLRGLTCPEPVIRTKKSFDNTKTTNVEALVDDEVNVQNLKRLASSLKTSFSFRSEGSHYRVVLERGGVATALSPVEHAIEHETFSARMPVEKKDVKAGTVLLITKDTFGHGDAEFSKQLLNLFLQTLYESGHRPRAILMANSGVKLMHPDEQFDKVLSDFRASGTEVLACGLCVDFYGLKDHVPKEQITNMFAICEFIAAADKVISP